MNEILKNSRRMRKGCLHFGFPGSYFFNMWDMEVGERERGKKAFMCHTSFL